MKLLLLPITFLLCTFAIAQETIEKYVEEGVAYHDAGQYDLAIDAYRKALALDENSAVANYEIGLTYMYAKQYDNSLKHANKVIELNGQYLIPAYVTKGNCLDALGNSDEAIKTYNNALKKLGADYMLYYNLALTQYNKGDHTKATQSAINAIDNNPSHASSHLLLGYLMNGQKNKIQSILSLHYFLLLEPNSKRSAQALQILDEQFSGNVERDGPNNVNIFLSPESLDKKNEFGAADMMISLLAASNGLEENKGKSDEELFITNTESFFKILGELKKKKNKGLWWEFYIPFYYELAKSKHIDTYCYFITQSTNDKAADWLKSNSDRLEELNGWLRQ
jgi:lipopolysaccharide biosynthesis regulator YciM